MRQSLLLSMVAVLATATACTQAPEEESASSDSALNEATTPRRGSAIDSAYVNPNATYWGARGIGLLTKVGALTDPTEIGVAKRADGIIASSPANGAIGIDELVELEKRAATLFPEEQAALPRIWKYLEIPIATKVADVKAELSIVNRVDDYVTKPALLPVTSTVERVARRIQLTADSDGDKSTISGSDVAKAQADRGSYLPEEAGAFRTIVRDIATHVTPIPADAQRIVFKATPNAGMVVYENSDVRISVENEAAPQDWVPSETKAPVVAYAPSIYVRRKSNEVRIVTLDLKTGAEKLADEVALEIPVAAIESGKQIEIWKGGNRVALEGTTAARAELAFPAGYAVQIGTGPLLVPEYTDISSVIGRKWAVRWETKASSRPGLASGSYIVSTMPGVRVDLFENGRVVVVDAKGTARDCIGATKTGAKEVKSCRFKDELGTDSMIYLSPKSNELPGLGYTTPTGAELYPY